MSVTLSSDYFVLDVSARKRYDTVIPHVYGWVFDLAISIGRKSPADPFVALVNAQGLLEDPAVRMIQALTGTPLRELRSLLVRATDYALGQELLERM